ncbi:glycosyltransferase [cf. Phormidesmis sp. LEGE 11477]|uniref:glycosyltransferase n=1 Tax=cf. Phormidesmis sp. LEGE 11477 TaxID=1828680 RepID=UPI001D148D00|nr:glycosyltransferase [cf. Phormidesmis sp. LEGE 11477]
MLSATFPYPPTRGGTSVRTFNLLKYLKQQGHHISLGTLRSPDVTFDEIEALAEWVDQLAVFNRPADASSPSSLRKMQQKAQRLADFAVSGVPPSVSTTHSEDMQIWVDQQIASDLFDAITCEHCVNEAYVPDDILRKVPVAVVNIHSSVYGTCAHQLAGGMAEKPWRDRINLPLLKRYEHHYCQKFSHLVVTTTEDQAQIQSLSGKNNIQVIPNGVDLEAFPYRVQDPGGQQLVFIGAMDNLPNIDAVTFLAQKILPLIRAHYPDTTLSLVGARPTPTVQALGNLPNVTVTGKVPEMTPYLHESAVCVIPMRTGYGIKNKTLEAMAAGIPVVASDRGLEGLEVDGDRIPLRALRANTAEEFTEAIQRLFESIDLRRTLSANGRRMIEEGFTWAIAGKRYEQLLCTAEVSDNRDSSPRSESSRP